ncbi:MAG TPA: glutamyl-tRNA reductase [Clostridiaceae bacterium]
MKIVVASINFDNAELAIREKVHFTGSKKQDCYALIKKKGILSEAIILSTCNRSEIYVVMDDDENIDCMINIFKEEFDLSPKEIRAFIELKVEGSAIEHIFEVAGGFKSMVIGEDQILGQVKEAYFYALGLNASGKILNKLFLTAITFGKKFRSCSGISDIPTSISSIGVKLLKSKINSLKGKKALVIGFGEMNKIILKYLLNEFMDKIYVANRTPREIDIITDNVEIIPFQDRYKVLGEVDVIISATSAPHLVLSSDKFNSNYKGKELCILDLALPRDVEATISYNENVEIFVIDDLKELSGESLKERARLMSNYGALMEEEMERFYKWRRMSEIISSDNSSVG